MDDFKTFVESLTNAALHHLPVLLPLSFIFVKLVLIRISGHKEDQWRAILTIPEDVSYGALALIIAGLNGEINAFNTYFKNSLHPHADMWTCFGMGVGVCYAVHLIHQHLVLPQYQGWVAADNLIIEQEKKGKAN